jgi:tRNA nucleotidyltransferase (CCA-adding enzyme)
MHTYSHQLGRAYGVNYADLEGQRGFQHNVRGAYILGVERPLRTFDGQCIAVLRRQDGGKVLVLAPISAKLIETEIRAQLDFAEGRAPYTLECKFECSCGALVYHKAESGRVLYLLIKNRRSTNWGFPKGHVEAGETAEETALREVQEETGLKIRLLEGFKETSKYDIQSWVEKKVVFFLAESDTLKTVRQAEEIDICQWLTFEEALRCLHFEKDKRVLNRARFFLRARGIVG